MSNAAHNASNTAHNVVQEAREQLTFSSGEQGTTGREPFEDSIATAGGQAYTSNNTTGDGAGVMSASGVPGQGAHHSHEHHGAHGTAGGIGAGATGQSYESQSRTGEHGLTGNHGSSGLTGNHGSSGLTGNHGSSGLTGDHSQHQHSTGGITGALTGNHGDHGRSDVGRTGQSGASRIDEQTTDRLPTHNRDHNRGEGYGDNNTSGNNNTHYDNARVGGLNEGGSNYERTGAGGPTTSGAAGTDRFDSDRTHGAGSYGGGERVAGEATHPGQGKGTGGVTGLLNTTDKDFTGRDRVGGATGQDAYEDNKGHFQSNTSGPGGNTALTGREGNLDNNPVAGNTHAGGATGHQAGVQGQHKEGLMEKVKHAVGM